MDGRLDDQNPQGDDQTPKGKVNVWAWRSTAAQRRSPGTVGHHSPNPDTPNPAAPGLTTLPGSGSGSGGAWLVIMLVALMVLLLSFARWDGPGGAASTRPCQTVGLSELGDA